MADPKKTTTTPKKATKKETPAVASLQEELKQVTEQANLAVELETTLEAANARITALSNDLTKTREENARLRSKTEITRDDLVKLARSKAIIEFDRDFKKGTYFVKVRGTDPTIPRFNVRAPDLISALVQIRKLIK